MAFVNPQGIKISYECSELIEELKQDIEEFGGDTIVAVWCKENDGLYFTRIMTLSMKKSLLQKKNCKTKNLLNR